MTPTGLGRFTIVLGLATALTAPLGAQRSRNSGDQSDRTSRTGDTETVTKTVPLSASGHLHLTTFSGYVHITGTSGHDVRIKAVRRADRDVLDRVHLTIDTSSSSVTINANDRDESSRSRTDEKIVETDFDIEMPASASLQINGFSSPLEITDVTGDQRLKTFSGRITVKGAREAVDAETFNADIDVDVAGAGAAPSLNAHTFSGSIKAHVAESAKASVTFKSFSGGFDSDLPLTMRTMRRGNVSGQMGGRTSGDAELRFQTFSGDVRVSR